MYHQNMPKELLGVDAEKQVLFSEVKLQSSMRDNTTIISPLKQKRKKEKNVNLALALINYVKYSKNGRPAI